MPKLTQLPKMPGINFHLLKSRLRNCLNISQGPDDLFQDFVSRLMQTASRLIGDTEARLLIVKQLAFENANAICKTAFRSFRKKVNISDYIRICSDIGLSYTQGLAITAAKQRYNKEGYRASWRLRRWPNGISDQAMSQ